MPDVLSVPSEFSPILTPVPGASADDIELGYRYWDVAGMTGGPTQPHLSPTTRWTHNTVPLADAHNVASGRLYLSAAAGVQATLAQHECRTCHQPVLLKSRTTLDAILRGADATDHCGRCDSNFQGQLATERDPARRHARHERAARQQERRRAEAEQREQQENARRLEQQLHDLRRQAVIDNHPLPLADQPVDWSVVRGRLRVEMAVLALLDHAPSVSPIPAIESWDTQFAPSFETGAQLLAEALGADLVRVHPTATPLDAFLWDEDAADVLSGRFYASRAHWSAWQGETVTEAAAALRGHLRQRIDEQLRTRAGVDALIALVGDLIAAETTGYMDSELAAHHLPAVPDHHQQRLDAAARALAATRSLGECYSIAWRAVRNAAAASKQHPYAAPANMSTAAVNWFEQTATSAAADPSIELRVYGQSARHPVSALTRTTLISVLELDLMGTSPVAIADKLTADSRYPRPANARTTQPAPPDENRRNSEDDQGRGQQHNVTHEEAARPADSGGRGPDPTEPTGQDSRAAVRRRQLTEVLTSLQGVELDHLAMRDYLQTGVGHILGEGGLATESHNALSAAFESLAHFYTELTNVLPPQELVRTSIGFAWMVPGEVVTSGGEVRDIGEVLGQDAVLQLRTAPPF